MFHLAAYFGAVSTTVNTDLPALTDQVLTISNGHFRLTDSALLVGAQGGASATVDCRLDSPTLRLIGNPYVVPITTLPPSVADPRMMDMSVYPLPLPQREELALQITAGAAGDAFGLIWLQMGKVPIPPGRVQWIKLTSTTAAVLGIWTPVALVFQTSLPTGYFSVVGSRHESATAIAHRFIFPGQVWRPGWGSNNDPNAMHPNVNWNGAYGEAGRFVNDNPFQMEVLCDGTDNAHSFWVGIVPVGSL
jgi:hypothetical protein